MIDEQEPQYLVNKLSLKTSNKTTRHNTTNSKQLIAPFNQKGTQGDRGFSFTGLSYWNQLPNYIKEAENFGNFKKLLKTHFLNCLLNNPKAKHTKFFNFFTILLTNVKCSRMSLLV